MVESEKPAVTKKATKGGRKGGTLFPKINLKQALDYSTKLVSKTHTGPLPEKTILPGVFGSATNAGKIRASALKQFGLLEGSATAYKATKLAKEIDATVGPNRSPLIRRACLTPKVFRQIFDTLQGDTVSKARIEQIVRGLEVHPESAGECAQIFIDSALTAGLGTSSGDLLALSKAGEASSAAEVAPDDSHGEGVIDEDPEGVQPSAKPASDEKAPEIEPEMAARQGKPGVNLNLNVDPSSDPEKLEKQLKLLRQYGII
jgi:hypothetical protein